MVKVALYSETIFYVLWLQICPNRPAIFIYTSTYNIIAPQELHVTNGTMKICVAQISAASMHLAYIIPIDKTHT